ncbi:EF-hand domain-containing protein [Sphingomonas sp. ZB1N12]|uniref:EF-hand domain-containing protein n=1 Tax=Sphingomonas arabinosi TaxID=3096160 RepID=UPI002FC7F07A
MRILYIGIVAALAGCTAQTQRPHDGHGPAHGRGQLFISPMGEPFRASLKPGAARDLWFAGADTDGDGRITLAEFQHDAARFFGVLDRGKDGEIDPEDIAYYENVLVPEIRVASGGRGSRSRSGGGERGRGGSGRSGSQGMQFGNGDGKKSAAVVHERIGAGRFGFFDLPEPVISADANLNRGIDAGEFAKAAATRFAALDRNRDGALTRGELPRAGGETWRNGSDEPTAPPRERGEP